jgi:hypothetical protein
MAVKQDSATIAQNWAQRLGASTSKIQAGVMAVTVAPGQAAAANKAGYVQGVASAADKWGRNVAAVSLNAWQTDTVNKGIPRISTGATAAVPKMQAVMDKMIPYINAGLGQLPKRGGLDANIARMDSWARYMANFKK